MKGTMLRAAAGLLAVLAAPLAVAAAPSAAALMALAFPGWREGGGHLQTVTLAQLPGGARGGYAGWTEGANRVLAEAGPVLRFDEAHLTLIAGLVPAGADGKPAATQLTPMALAAYRFERRAGSWRLGGQDIFGLRGFAGSARLRALALPGRHQAVAVEYGSCFEGYCGSWLALYELDKDAVRHQPAVELALSGHNVDAAADCGRRLQPPARPSAPFGGKDKPVHDDGATAAAHDCYAIAGSWEVGPVGDLLMHYRGAISRADAQAPGPVAIDQRQVLRYSNGRYRAVSGFNPVPPI